MTRSFVVFLLILPSVAFGHAFEIPNTAQDTASLKKQAANGDANQKALLRSAEANSSITPPKVAETSEQKRYIFFRKAAEQGEAGAQYELGLMYASGIGVPRDYAQAASWLRKAAEQGNRDAERQLGYLYVSGHGVPKDASQAKMWLSKAAGQNPPTNNPANALTIRVLQSESVPYTMESGGGIYTNCNISGSTNSLGYGSSIFEITAANSNMRMNCNSYDRIVRWNHVMNTMFVEASDGNAYIIACDRAWRWSKCVPLQAGEVFDARFTEKGVEVLGLNAKRKKVAMKYRVIQSKSLR